MGGNKLKQRDSTNPKSNPVSQLNVNERILKECHQLYMDPENGLVEIASNLDLKLLAPRKKITIMLIGKHLAGKSSFINW